MSAWADDQTSTSSTTVVERDQLLDRAPGTAADALDTVPGISVQKLGPTGAIPAIRGRTSQETLILVDGFRINNAAMRGSPNPYLNGVDPAALARIEVLRGTHSVLYGSDAVAGVINLVPRAAAGGPTNGAVALRSASADRSGSARVEVDTTAGRTRVLAGLGARHAGELRGGGPLVNAPIPAYDGDVQPFTGHDALSADVHATTPMASGKLVAAAQVLRQYHAPRTASCTQEPLDCLYDDQKALDLAYVRYTGSAGSLRAIELGAVFARTLENRSHTYQSGDAPEAMPETGPETSIDRARDRVLTLGLTARAALPTWKREGSAARVSLGAETYLDLLASSASRELLPTGELLDQPRGTYLDGSSYWSAAAFAQGELIIDNSVSLTGGLRASLVRAAVARDPESNAPGFAQTTALPTGSAGVRVRLAQGLYAIGNFDRGFRAPNLDDLTARSGETAGYQLPNPDLEPEIAITFEGGLALRHALVEATGVAYQTYVDNLISRTSTVCPEALLAQCGGQRVFRLDNPDQASIHGIELAARIALPAGVSILGNLTWTVATRIAPGPVQQPEPRVPPIGGYLGVRFTGSDYFVETVARWALEQDRLSFVDVLDPSVPEGGTPAYGVVDVRAGARLPRGLRMSVTLENLLDVRYRIHGSGVDGPGFGVIAAVIAPFGG